MSHTNSTTNYNLPQFITTDKPAWLTDVNNAYSAIDIGMKAAKDAGDNAQSDATLALTNAGTAQTTANTANSKAGGAISSISEDFLDSTTYAVGDLVMYNNLLYRCHTAVGTPGAWTGSANWSRTDIDTLLSEINGNTLLMPSSPYTAGSLAAAIGDLNSNKADKSTTYTKTEVDAILPKTTYVNLTWANNHSWPIEGNQVYLLTTDSSADLAILRIYSDGTTVNLGIIHSGFIQSADVRTDGRVYVAVNNRGLIAVRIV